MTELVQEKLKTLPDSPGVYLMKNSQGKIIYVGKAIVLKNRVRQYFQSNKNHSVKVRAMVAKIADFETIVTSSEVEALILECNLIKKHRPRYNVCLKDDKSYPYLKLTLNEDFPRVFITRRIIDDGSKYFGPYTNSQAVKDSLELLRKLFPLRTCKTLGKRPCLEYHINRCLAPCVNKISRADYADLVKATEKFLEGKTADVERDLTAKISQAAESLNFELAAKLRDILLSVKKISEKQKIVTDTGDLDAIGISRLNAEVCAQIFFIRDGKVTGRESFLLNGAADESDEKVIAEFIKQYYSRTKISATEILLPITLSDDDTKILAEWLGVKIFEPKRGVKRSLVEMAIENAEKYLAELSARQELKTAQTSRAVEDLQKFLHLPKLPRKMECFDISHFQGAETVASMVVFENGEPSKKNYRRFKIRSTEGKPDDFMSMREVTSRRYGKLTAEELPDLIVIDGGIGQLNSALEIIRGFGHEVPVVGLAKEFELIFVEGESEPIELPRDSQALYLMQRIRDEAHRFAITYHRKLRRARNLKSELDNVVGIGTRRREELLKKFGTIDKIKSATLDELLTVQGMNRTAAESLINFFNVK
ncbi:MAG: excinuclease ABC subunit UvrC, partial [Selenomonadaceae bacterium]|nr:excinuclease ABC subunit UvrC [Selenomonadaceae bacterium]